MRKVAICVAVLGSVSGFGSVAAQAGWNGWGASCGCGAPIAYAVPEPSYAVTTALVARPVVTRQWVVQPMLVTVPTGPDPGYVVNQGQYRYGDGIGVVPYGPLGYPGYPYGYDYRGYRFGYGHPGYRFGYGYGYGYRGYYRRY